MKPFFYKAEETAKQTNTLFRESSTSNTPDSDKAEGCVARTVSLFLDPVHTKNSKCGLLCLCSFTAISSTPGLHTLRPPDHGQLLQEACPACSRMGQVLLPCPLAPQPASNAGSARSSRSCEPPGECSAHMLRRNSPQGRGARVAADSRLLPASLSPQTR